MKNIPEQDLQVAEFLKSINVDYSVKWIGIAGNNSNFKDSDQWQITFKKAGKFSESFDFYTGSNHRVLTNPDGRSLSFSNKKFTKSLNSVTGLSFSIVTESKTSVIVERNKSGYSYAVTPTQASVLYCLLLDAESGSMSFDDFCDNFGYNNDSISDFKTYQACMAITKQVQKLFTYSERQQLQELLQDY
jgi:hypothetical protein